MLKKEIPQLKVTCLLRRPTRDTKNVLAAFKCFTIELPIFLRTHLGLKYCGIISQKAVLVLFNRVEPFY